MALSSQERELLLQEAYHTISSMLHGETYKKNNNHGLSVDIALLNAFKDKRLKCRFKDGVDLVANRVMEQLSHIFDLGGISREHSVSYQEYNAVLVKDLLEAIDGFSDAQENSWVRHRLDQIIEATRAFLGFALTSEGAYMPLGDSSRSPAPKQLKKIFGVADPRLALAPYEAKTGMMVAPNGGFCFIRDSVLHASITSSWHSYVHKQDDDLAISIAVDGKTFIDDGGYSSIANASHVKLVDSHSSITVEDSVWLPKNARSKGFSQIRAIVSDTAMKGVWCRHNRMGSITERFMGRTSEGEFVLIDRVPDMLRSRHRFILGPTAVASIDGPSVSITDGTNVLHLIASGDGQWLRSKVDVVYDDRVRSADTIDFWGNAPVTFTGAINRIPRPRDFHAEAEGWTEEASFEGWRIYDLAA